MKTMKRKITLSTSEILKLVETLGSTSPIERERARKRLVAAGHEAVIPLLHKLKAPSEHVCWEAAKALSEIKDPASANALAETLDHASHDVRWLAAEGLIAVGSEGLKQTLIALLTKADSNGVRKGAHHVISHFAHRMSGEFLLPLLKLFDDFEPAVIVPLAALDALHKLQNRTMKSHKK